MRILFIGGTGNISSSVSRLLVGRGHELHLLTRGTRGGRRAGYLPVPGQDPPVRIHQLGDGLPETAAEPIHHGIGAPGKPVLGVRPSHTYDTVLPLAIGGWQDDSIIERLRRGKAVVVHGDGTSLWTLTHSEDFARGFAGLLGDKAHSILFDNTKIKTFVPGYQALIPFREGIRRTLAWFEASPERRKSTGDTDRLLDRLIVAYGHLSQSGS